MRAPFFWASLFYPDNTYFTSCGALALSGGLDAAFILGAMPLSSAPASGPAWAHGLSGVPGGVLAFAAMCVLGGLAIVCGVLFEVGRVRREDAMARGQFAWRLASAVVWCAALGLLGYATSWGWPRQALQLGLDGRGWLRLLGWAMMLILLGIVLLAQDVWRVRRRSWAQEQSFRAGLSLLAQQEIERAKDAKDSREHNPRSEISNNLHP